MIVLKEVSGIDCIDFVSLFWWVSEDKSFDFRFVVCEVIDGRRRVLFGISVIDEFVGVWYFGSLEFFCRFYVCDFIELDLVVLE